MMKYEVGNNEVSKPSEGRVSALFSMDWYQTGAAFDQAKIEQQIIDAGYCIDAPDSVPIGGVVVKPRIGPERVYGRFKPGAWRLPASDECVWMAGYASWNQAR